MRMFDFSQMQAPDRGSGFEMPGYWVWCGSAVYAPEDGRYHMFAARWSKERPFFSGYLFSSEIVHAVSDRPEGPFTYLETVLPDRGEQFWDGRMTHNPSIYAYGGKYYLFYIGGTYTGERPTKEALLRGDADVPIPALGGKTKKDEVYSSIRIGVAVASSIYGPWTRFDAPAFEVNPDPNAWDHSIVTNPTACFLPDGTIFLYYRSNMGNSLKLGAARAHVDDLHFERVYGPLFEDHPDWSAEDLYVWYNGENFEMIAKDIRGNICGEKWGGAHFVSQDGLHWETADPSQAYSRTLTWADGSSETLYHFERPCLLIEDGRPRCMYAALGIAGDTELSYENTSFSRMTESKNIAIRFS